MYSASAASGPHSVQCRHKNGIGFFLMSLEMFQMDGKNEKEKIQWSLATIRCTEVMNGSFVADVTREIQ